MDNTQIRHSAYGNTTGFYRISQVEALMELARADERAKLQGVDVWISWDAATGFWETCDIWHVLPPILTEKGHYDGAGNSNISVELAEKLGVAKGECVKFKIVRQP